MKKILLSLFSAILFTGCTTTKGFETQTEIITLTGNHTTGYTWTFEIENEEIIKIEEQETYLGEERMVGAPSLFTYNISSLKPGKAKIKFEYSRPWENLAPLKKVDYDITVDKKGKIEIKKVEEK